MKVELDLSYNELMLLITSVFITGFGMREGDDIFILRRAIFDWHAYIGLEANAMVSLEKKLAEAAEKFKEELNETKVDGS
ncbi:hypothetical protein LCGC14_1132130 [marine sediment metagenome]|uniref:Uncharacterized protein n=1 Tax=marine sediment metagenome TaxID=412755 RepID=A0A0F9IXL2_9ZZZZ